MVEVFGININEEFNELIYNQLMSYVSVEKRERIKKFHRIEDAQRSLIGDVLARYMICNKLNLKNEQLIFDMNEYGKPFLKNSDKIHFNISHAGEWVMCATHNLPIGIDIERVQSINFEIAERYFSKEEYMDFLKREDGQKLNFFYELWTLKESYIKAEGKGLSIPLDSFTIKISDDIKIFTDKGKECFFRQSVFDNNYILSICTHDNQLMDHIRIISTLELVNQFRVYFS